MKTKRICWKNSIYGYFDSNLQAWHNFGVGCHQIVADCFCNTDGIVNGDSLRGAEDSGKGKQAPLISVSHAYYPYRWNVLMDYCYTTPTGNPNDKLRYDLFVG